MEYTFHHVGDHGLAVEFSNEISLPTNRKVCALKLALERQAICGIPELIQPGKTGELFESGNLTRQKNKIRSLWKDLEKINRYTRSCECFAFDSPEGYVCKLLNIYRI